MPNTATTKLSNLLSNDTVRIRLPGRTKTEVLQHLVHLVGKHPCVSEIDDVYEAVMQREALMSTGVGNKLGFPHAKTDAVRCTLAAFAVTTHPINFEAIDGEPVRLLFLLVGPAADQVNHIKLLSQVSRMMSDAGIREQLLAAKSRRQVLRIFAENERKMADKL